MAESSSLLFLSFWNPLINVVYVFKSTLALISVIVLFTD